MPMFPGRAAAIRFRSLDDSGYKPGFESTLMRLAHRGRPEREDAYLQRSRRVGRASLLLTSKSHESYASGRDIRNGEQFRSMSVPAEQVYHRALFEIEQC